jgi:late competence protein required for DNA uptake (superfamily II DNA/RNA helicase)
VNLQPVTRSSSGREVLLRCVRCHHWHTETEMVADLDGAAFVDYYCPECAAVKRAEAGQ